mmetsp:Transcript_23073/g.64980  ORF Transcript_23073/g.64980 Transcript_23073/m.64980 type:complete len:472 (+) Transcript_23073:296-1711(+)
MPAAEAPSPGRRWLRRPSGRAPRIVCTAPELAPAVVPSAEEPLVSAPCFTLPGRAAWRLEDAAAVSAEEAPRARHRTCADVVPAQVDTLVVKRLAAGLQEGELLRLLEERGSAASAAVSAQLLRTPEGCFLGTAFVRYATPEAAQAALEALGARPRLGGRRAHVEPQKSKVLLGGRELEMLLSQDELATVRRELECFLHDPAAKEVGLPSDFTPHQRKYAHSLAEQHGLAHTSRQGPCCETYVHLARVGGGGGHADRRGGRQRPKLLSEPSPLGAGFATICLADAPGQSANALRGVALGGAGFTRRSAADDFMDFPPGLGGGLHMAPAAAAAAGSVCGMAAAALGDHAAALLVAAAAAAATSAASGASAALPLSLVATGLGPALGLLPGLPMPVLSPVPLDAIAAAAAALGTVAPPAFPVPPVAVPASVHAVRHPIGGDSFVAMTEGVSSTSDTNCTAAHGRRDGSDPPPL